MLDELPRLRRDLADEREHAKNLAASIDALRAHADELGGTIEGLRHRLHEQMAVADRLQRENATLRADVGAAVEARTRAEQARATAHSAAEAAHAALGANEHELARVRALNFKMAERLHDLGAACPA